MKNVLITGASWGIGLAEAKRLENNYKLYLTAKDKDSFKNKALRNASLFGYDFSKKDKINDFTKELKGKCNCLDVLANNVGVMVMKKFEQMTDKDIEIMFNLNLKSHILLTKKLLPLLFKAKNPKIVFMSSMAADQGSTYAILNLANMYEKGLGGEKDIDLAVNLYKAAENADWVANIYLARIYKKQGKIEESKKYYKKGLNHSRIKKFVEMVDEARDFLSKKN